MPFDCNEPERPPHLRSFNKEGAILQIFVATSPEQVPAGIDRFVSVDGSVPGWALRYDHHVTGERTNLDAMPPVLALADEGFDGIATTNADADAVASVVVALLGGRKAVPEQAYSILQSASHWCDHLRPMDGLGDEINRLGRGLLDHIATRLSAARGADRSACFSALSLELLDDVRTGRPLPFRDGYAAQRARCRPPASGLHSRGRGRGPDRPAGRHLARPGRGV
jgi:hypothetical protein